MTVVTSIGYWPEGEARIRVGDGRATVELARSVLIVHDQPQALRDLGDALLDAARKLDARKAAA